jgi:hypothetical protein
MSEASLITHDELDEQAPMVALPSWPSDCEPDSGTVRAIAQILALSFGAHQVVVTADFGETGTVNWAAPHPELVAIAQADMSDHDAEYDE